LPHDAVSGVLPALSNEGKLLMASKSSISVAPDGNGGTYAAIRQPLSSQPDASVLIDMRSRGIQYVHAYCVDNCLVRIADPVFMGYCIAKRAACGVKVVKKLDPRESVGVLALKGDAYSVVEYSELSADKAGAIDELTGELAFRAANIANHFYTVDFLDSVEEMESKMAFHIARKKIPTIDMSTGELIKPSEPNGMKLELFVFDVFPFTKQLEILEVGREDEFSPLKNGPGTKSDNPETSKRDLLAMHARWLKEAGAEVADGVEVELSPAITYSGEGLAAVKGLRITKSGSPETIEELKALA
jgi:UDP-N-acetylglucosamine/UDP-N-acetylgalactosamine diphosphorylase